MIGILKSARTVMRVYVLRETNTPEHGWEVASAVWPTVECRYGCYNFIYSTKPSEKVDAHPVFLRTSASATGNQKKKDR